MDNSLRASAPPREINHGVPRALRYEGIHAEARRRGEGEEYL